MSISSSSDTLHIREHQHTPHIQRQRQVVVLHAERLQHRRQHRRARVSRSLERNNEKAHQLPNRNAVKGMVLQAVESETPRRRNCIGHSLQEKKMSLIGMSVPGDDGANRENHSQTSLRRRCQRPPRSTTRRSNAPCAPSDGGPVRGGALNDPLAPNCQTSTSGVDGGGMKKALKKAVNRPKSRIAGDLAGGIPKRDDASIVRLPPTSSRHASLSKRTRARACATATSDRQTGPSKAKNG
jgi:hypothetical protein